MIDDRLELAQRRIADAHRRVVAEPHAGALLAQVEVDEVGRAGPDERVEPDVAHGVEGGDVLAQPLARALDDELGDRHARVVERLGRPARDVDLDRLEHAPAAERGLGGAGPQQSLVDVVMQQQALAVEPAQRQAEPFGQRIADAVGMAEPLAFDHLDGERLDRRGLECLDRRDHSRTAAVW